MTNTISAERVQKFIDSHTDDYCSLEDCESCLIVNAMNELLELRLALTACEKQMEVLREHYRQLGAESLGADIREAKDAARYRYIRATGLVKFDSGMPIKDVMLDTVTDDFMENNDGT